MTRELLVMASVGFLVLAPCTSRSQSAEELDELDAICTKAREEKIREVQRQKIEECLKEPPPARAEPKSREECERYWGDYGWSKGTASGGARADLFADIPECVRAFEARQKRGAR